MRGDLVFWSRWTGGKPGNGESKRLFEGRSDGLAESKKKQLIQSSRRVSRPSTTEYLLRAQLITPQRRPHFDSTWLRELKMGMGTSPGVQCRRSHNYV